jgi:hypothetical protein
MTTITTNRELYRFIAELGKRDAKSTPTLERYLENLRARSRPYCERDALPPAAFAELLRAAFDEPPENVLAGGTPTESYRAWERRIEEQIHDLREMAKAGVFDNDLRYFGVQAPSGSTWYNFDPATFLECAAAGSFDGWEEGDATGRMFVPGPVAVIDASGAMTSVDPRATESSVAALPPITWEMFVDFLDMGRLYE